MSLSVRITRPKVRYAQALSVVFAQMRIVAPIFVFYNLGAFLGLFIVRVELILMLLSLLPLLISHMEHMKSLKDSHLTCLAASEVFSIDYTTHRVLNSFAPGISICACIRKLYLVPACLDCRESPFL